MIQEAQRQARKDLLPPNFLPLVPSNRLKHPSTPIFPTPIFPTPTAIEGYCPLFHQMTILDLPNVERKGILILHRSGIPINKPPSDQPPVIFMLSGFPDTVETFEEFAEHFESSYHVVRIAFPDFEEESLRRYWGYDFDEIADSLAVVIREYRDDLGCKKTYFLGHDWGAFIGPLYAEKYPDTLTKMVLEDVGLTKSGEFPLWSSIGVVSYQGYLAFLFVVSRLIGNDRWTTWFRMSFFLFPWFLLGPLKFTDKSWRSKMPKPHHCYPYYHMIRRFLSQERIGFPFPKKVKHMYCYGVSKNYLFHTKSYINRLSKQGEGFCSKGYTTAGHWVHESHTDEMARDVLAYLEDKD